MSASIVGLLKLDLPSKRSWGLTSPKWGLGCRGQPLNHRVRIHMFLIQSTSSGFSAQGWAGESQGASLAGASRDRALCDGGREQAFRGTAGTKYNTAANDAQHGFRATALRGML